jgi:hypothetical protein
MLRSILIALPALTLAAVLRAQDVVPAVAADPGPPAPEQPVPEVAAPVAAAPEPAVPDLAVVADFPLDRWLAAGDPVRLRLSRPLAAGDGRLAVLVGRTDVTSLTRVTGSEVTYAPAGLRLPTGETEMVTYLVTGAGEWRELARVPLRILTRSGFQQAAVRPALDLVSDGQLGRGGNGAEGQPGRERYQDLTSHMGFQATLARPGWTLRTQANALGVSQEQQRLRFSQLGLEAPAVDLSDYLVAVESGRVSASVGHVSFGTSRHLASGFASRGATGAVRLHPGVSVGLAAVGGASMVGWSNALGLSRPGHRIFSGNVDFELVPTRPGAVRLALSALDGSVLPVAGYTQGAVNDAERSRGVAVEVGASDARQRVRVAAGLTRSRFVNPPDALLDQGATVVRVRSTTRTARFAEATLNLVQNRRIAAGVLATLSGNVRHEKVDPLFRSVAAAPRADYQQNVVGGSATVGALALQYSHTSGRDNLAHLGSILTTKALDDQLNATLPLGSLVRAGAEAWWWPGLTFGYQVNRQAGEGVPDSGGFSASHVPDQLSRNRTVQLAWQRPAWNLTYRFNRTDQDNRQTGRERADFRGLVHGLTLGTTPVPALTLSLDLSHERQRSFETDELQRTRRVGGQAEWRVFRWTVLQGFASESWSDDEPRTQQARNLELRAEVSQGLNLYARPASGTQSRAFVRYSRTAARNAGGEVGFVPERVLWSVAAGMSMQLY